LASGLSNGPDVVQSFKFQHPVEGGRCDGDLSHLGFIRARSKGVANYVFVLADLRLDPGSAIIAAGFLSAHPAVLGDGPEMEISLCEEAISAAALGTAMAYGGTMTAASGWRVAITQ
jgi:hypothetical protein